jgi:hypothetical protein
MSLGVFKYAQSIPLNNKGIPSVILGPSMQKYQL